MSEHIDPREEVDSDHLDTAVGCRRLSVSIHPSIQQPTCPHILSLP